MNSEPNTAKAEQLLRLFFAPTQPLYPVLMPPRGTRPPHLLGTTFNRIDRNLIASGGALTTLSMLPADLRLLIGDDPLRVPSQILPRHAVVFFYADDFDTHVMEALSRFPFLAGFDLRGTGEPLPAAPPGHLWAVIHESNEVLQRWAELAIQAVERVAGFWPEDDITAILRALGGALASGQRRNALREIRPLEACRYLQPNGVIRNIVLGPAGNPPRSSSREFE